MTESRKRSLILPVVVTLAVLLVAYAGSYFKLVSPGLDTGVVPYRVFPEYPLLVQVRPATMKQSPLLSFWQGVFFPVHWIDCHIRPHVWDSELHPMN